MPDPHAAWMTARAALAAEQARHCDSPFHAYHLRGEPGPDLRRLHDACRAADAAYHAQFAA